MRFKEKYMPYMRFAPTVALLSGFIFDIFTLRRPDEPFENISMLGYILLSALFVALLQRTFSAAQERKRILLLSALQFSFGHLAGVLMVLYAHSGTFAGSAIFIILLGALFLGNEVFKEHYSRDTLRIAIWFFLLLSYSTIIVPIILGKIGITVFSIGVAIALLVAVLFLKITAYTARKSLREHIQHVYPILISITIIFSLLYLGNFIPPVPLATKQIGIYHRVTHIKNAYIIEYEPAPWYEFWRDTSVTLHIKSGEPLYCFSSIFAPSRLNTQIYHAWEKFNLQEKRWKTVARISFPIFGGRASGYRGYTLTQQASNGLWRCRVETARGTALGQTTFVVKIVNTNPPMQIKKL